MTEESVLFSGQKLHLVKPQRGEYPKGTGGGRLFVIQPFSRTPGLLCDQESVAMQ